MMEILHKAKRLDTGEWIFGGSIIQFLDNGERTVYMPQFKEKCICTHDAENDNILSFDKCVFYKVDPETVCVYTEKCDKRKNRICEKDIVKNEKGDTGVIQWFPEHSAFMIWEIKNNKIHYLGDNDCSKIEIIGNEIDNPELLEEE